MSDIEWRSSDAALATNGNFRPIADTRALGHKPDVRALVLLWLPLALGACQKQQPLEERQLPVCGA